MASSAKVLCDAPETFSRSLFGRPSSGSYRAAIAQVIRDVKARNALSNARLAEIIGCSEQTIANAESEHPENDMKAVTLLSIAYAFGEEAIAPVRQLYLCAPVNPSCVMTELDRAEKALRAARDRILKGGIDA